MGKTLRARAMPGILPEIPPPTQVPSTPTSTLSDPAEFIRWYFTAIWSERNYAFMWENCQTNAFHQSAASNDYQGFVDYYDSVRKIDVSYVNILENDGRTAFVDVGLVYHMKANWSDSHTIEFKLIYNRKTGYWMFDSR